MTKDLHDLPSGEPQSGESNRVRLGVIEFHSERVNPGLIERFYAVRDDLTNASCIVDFWLLDIARLLAEFGYDMRVYRTPEKQKVHNQSARNKKD